MPWHPGGPVGDPHSGPGYSGRNRQTSNGGPSGVQRSSAAQLKETEALFSTYEHLQGLPRGDAALTMLRKVASMVKPIMRKRGWRVQVLAEFCPPEQNLLGLNVNKGYKICLRLRYHSNPDLFLPVEEVVDTMLHELSHNVWGDHDSNFHKLWEELRDEHEALVRKGYTGEGFLSEGKRLGGSSHRMPPPHEMRRLAQASAEKRKQQGTLSRGSGQKLGGAPLHAHGGDIRQVIADQITRRNTIQKGCASGRSDAGKLSQDSSDHTFKTKAKEDDANNRAIAQALYELMEQEEEQKLNGTFAEPASKGGLAWSPENGLYDAGMRMPSASGGQDHPGEEEQMKWAMQESLHSGSLDGIMNAANPIFPPATAGFERTTSGPPIPLDPKPIHSAQDQEDTKPPIQRERTAPPASSPLTKASIEQEPNDQEPIKPESDLPSNSLATELQHLPDDQWACEICTCINPLQFLACDACGVERPQSAIAKAQPKPKPKPRAESAPTSKVKKESGGTARRWEMPPPKQNESLGWNCGGCGAFMEHKWWTCSACGVMKGSS